MRTGTPAADTATAEPRRNVVQWRTRALVGVLAIAILVLGGLASRRALLAADAAQSAMPHLLASRSDPPSGREVVMVLVGSSTCDAATSPEIPAALDSIRRALSRHTLEQGAAFASVGVALDRDFAAGVGFLARLGEFDEISIGRKWMNSHAVAHMWRDHPGRGATPQIIIIERDLQVEQSAIAVTPDRVIARKVGVDNILEWARNGAPIATEIE
jgi:hypothetical protein